jgi:hypothetical protein
MTPLRSGTLLHADELRHSRCEAVDVSALEQYAQPVQRMNKYDQLLQGRRAHIGSAIKIPGPRRRLYPC